MRHSIIPFQQKDINKILENLVYHHLVANQYSVHVGKLGDREVDFVAEKNGKYIYIQVAYLIVDQKTHEREFGNLLKIQDNFDKIVVSMDNLPTSEYKGILHQNIREFLMKFE